MAESNNESYNYRVRELTELRLTLREDLQFTPHHESGESCYLIEDTVRSQYFRIGIGEYLFISMFDGKTSIGDALVRLARVKGDHALTAEEATIICKWLIDSELAFTDASTRTDRLAEISSAFITQKNMGRLNPVCTRLPLFYPDRFFAKITPLAKRIFGKLAAVIGFFVALFAAYKIAMSWNAFMLAAEGISSPSRWLWLLIVWVGLKLVHEFAHGTVCRKHGGAVHEAGAVFVLFVPLAYVDLTSSWRFRSKWQRIHTAAAGMYIELWIASIAAIVWSNVGPGLLSDICFNIVVMASLTTLVFNANPLMRFDGYYMLSDWLEIPNLYSQGNQYLTYLTKRYVMGESIGPPLDFSWREIFIRLYGLSAFAWRMFICFWIVVGASMLFHGIGLVLAIAAVGMWVGFPLYRLHKYLFQDDGSQWHRCRRLAIASCLGLIAGFMTCKYVPWPGAHRARAIVQYEPLSIIRAESAGFVREVFAEAGQIVRANQPIARLENNSLLAELRDLEYAIEQSILKSRVFKQTEEMHSFQAEMEQLASLRSKRDEKQQQVDALLMRADTDGRLVARNLDLHLGTYLEIGDELAAIGNETHKELHLAIPQEDFKHFQSHVGKSINARLTGGVVIESKVDRVVPRANSYAPHESMYATNGGPLANRANSEAENDSQELVLLKPHFTGVVSLSPQQSQQLFVGQRGTVWFGHGQQSLGTVLLQTIRRALPESFIKHYSVADSVTADVKQSL